MLTAFAGQAALALERALAQEEREMYVILEDRERIARDLHDVVIQRLFATGMQLQTAARLAGRPEVAEPGQRRGRRPGHHDPGHPVGDLRAAHADERRAARRDPGGWSTPRPSRWASGPRCELVGPVDSAVPAELRADLLAVLREALSNVVRMPAASLCDVVVRRRTAGAGDASR